MQNEAVNTLTGHYISKEAASKRPVAVVINNLYKALPQSGLSQADIIYEVLAEGDITRLVAIFQEHDSQKIGPVRSARDYFLHFARDNEAVFVHHGGSPRAYSDISSLGVNNIDGMTAANVFWRDSVRASQAGMYEHSSYTSSDKLKSGIEAKGFSQERSYEKSISEENVYTGMFNFYDESTTLNNAEIANVVKVPFADSIDATFTYDEENMVYLRSQFGQKHIDEETGEQLQVTNILIQLTEIYLVQGDEAGRRTVKTIGQGQGYLITGGRCVPITWKKDSYSSPTEWYDATGNKLVVNKGKTWICVSESDKPIYFE